MINSAILSLHLEKCTLNAISKNKINLQKGRYSFTYFNQIKKKITKLLFFLDSAFCKTHIRFMFENFITNLYNEPNISPIYTIIN